jgi:shikimate 5-dehydrogenase
LTTLSGMGGAANAIARKAKIQRARRTFMITRRSKTVAYLTVKKVFQCGCRIVSTRTAVLLSLLRQAESSCTTVNIRPQTPLSRALVWKGHLISAL